MNDRQILLDTETTGLSAADGHRIIEIGCVELIDRRLSGRTLHLYIDPERDIDEGAMQVHGITLEMLAGKPLFADVADQITDFMAGAEVLIHNAAFDVGFLNAELKRLRKPLFPSFCDQITDTLAMARELHPGRRNSLDALCDRYGISNAHRKLHGALLDAELLSEVYLGMTRGQDSLAIVSSPTLAVSPGGEAAKWPPVALQAVQITESELAAHQQLLDEMASETGAQPLWRDSDSG